MPARELGPNFVLVTVESDEEQAMHRLPLPRCQSEQAHDARVDRCGVLHFKRARAPAGAPSQPEYIDEPH